MAQNTIPLPLALRQWGTRLKDAGIESPMRETRLLCAHYLSCSYEELNFSADQLDFSEAHRMQIDAAIQRREKREPLAKILGYKDFWKQRFHVNAHTLDPRPDSEILLEVLVADPTFCETARTILDLGTGSGCLLLSALEECPHAIGIGIDISEDALSIAQRNAYTLGFEKRSFFVCDDWGQALRGSFDLILCNPPYIDPAEVLDPSTLYDPATALFAPDRGLGAYKTLAMQLPSFCHAQTRVLLEIGQGQSQDVCTLFRAQGFHIEAIAQDLAGIERCIVLQRP